MSGSATYPQPASLHSGDIVEWLRSLPADQIEEFDLVQSMAIVVRVGSTNLYQVGPNHVDVHTHDTADEATQCFAETVAVYRETSAPDNPARQLAEAVMSGQMDLDQATQAARIMGQRARQGAVPALRQAAMPEGPTGMYL